MKRLVIITSEINSGKTATLEKISNTLKAKNISVGGFLSIADYKQGEKDTYNLKNIATDEEVPLATQRRFYTNITIGKYYFGKYYFYQQAFEKANDWLTDTREFDVIIIDEVGPLEMRGGGFYELLTNLFQDFKGVFIVAVRTEILEEFRIKFPHPETAIFATNTNIKEIVDYIVL